MRTITLNALRAGIERTRSKGGAKPDALFDLVNGYVTIDGSVQSRPGTTSVYELPAGTKGLCAFGGKLVVFSHAVQVMPAATPSVTCQVLVNPVTPGSAINDIHFAGPFLGGLYVVAEFSDGTTRHFWLRKQSNWTANTMFLEGSVVQPTSPNGLTYIARRIGPPNPLWAPDVERNLGDRVEPTVPNGYFYEVINLISPSDDTLGGTTAIVTRPPGTLGGGGAYAFTGTLPPAYVGVPYYVIGSSGDPWNLTGGDHVPRLTGTVPDGMTIEKGQSNGQANVYGIPLAAGTTAVNITVDEAGGPVYTQSLTVLARPAYGLLDFAGRYALETVAMLDANTARFDTIGRLGGLVTATAGKLYAEFTITGGEARVGIHAGDPSDLTIGEAGTPANTYGVLRTGTVAVALDAVTGKVWVSNSAGVFTGDPATGTTPGATLTLLTGRAYRAAINAAAGITVSANFGNSAFAYTPPTGFAGWALAALPVPAMWTSNGSSGAEVGRHSAATTWPPASEAGVMDYLRASPATDTYVGLAATFGKAAGQWQFEILAAGNVSALAMGLVKDGFSFAAGKAIGFEGSGDSVSVAHAIRDPATGVTWTETHSSLAGVHATSRLGQVADAVYTFACDFTALSVAIYRNGTLVQTVTGLPAGTWRPAMSGNWWPTAVLRATGLQYPVTGFSDWTMTP